jgi:hypothetical protein
MTTETKVRRQTKKEIWDWRTLADACADARRLPKQTPASEHALTLATRRTSAGRLAQMDERVIAIAEPCYIALWYMHTPKQSDLGESVLNDWVHVFPCAGGRTSYRIDDGVNGWFANRHLPINAKDRRTSSTYRSDQWWHGQSGVYQRGYGPYYPDAGPECANESADAIIAKTLAAPHLPDAWRAAAQALVTRLSSVLSPFRDVVLRYEVFGYKPDYPADCSDPFNFRAAGCNADGAAIRHVSLSSRYALTVRLKSPCVATDGGWRETPDFAVSITGPFPAIDGSPDVSYCVQLLHPSGRHVANEYRPDEDFSTGMDILVTQHPQKVIEAARQWAAGRIYIPCA